VEVEQRCCPIKDSLFVRVRRTVVQSRDALKAPELSTPDRHPEWRPLQPLEFRGDFAMPEYRFYVRGKDDRIAAPSREFECQDDRGAVEKAKQFLDFRAIEVWDRARFVARLDPAPPDAVLPVRRDDLITCHHCGTTYEAIWGPPARDSGSAQCEVCNQVLMEWSESAIPHFRIQKAATRTE
jgi:hypothetical protein